VLTDHKFEADYASEEDDILHHFYLPALAASNRYDRITGFFASSVFAIAWPSLRTFIRCNRGTIRLLCSPRLAEPDAEGIISGYRARSEPDLSVELRRELEHMLEQPALRNNALLLACLISSGALEVQLATVAAVAESRSKRMVHDKVGVFHDNAGNQVGFRGTFNETFLGLAAEGNIESVDVWTSWEGGKDARRLRDAVDRFERIWNGEARGIHVTKLPNMTVDQLRELAATADADALLAELEVSQAPARAQSDDWLLGERRLASHQQAAVAAWRGNRRVGLLAHATGAGKTVTGMFCIREALNEGLHPIVVVPSKLLLHQWDAEIRSALGTRTMLCGGGHSAWSGGLLQAAMEDDQLRVVIAIANSAASPHFIKQVRHHADRILLVADEAHRLGSRKFRDLLQSVPAQARLGLSATPDRAGDAEGTAVLFDYFDRTVHTFGIKAALDAGVLTNYEYQPSFVTLNDREQEEYERITKKIRRQVAINSRSQDASSWERLQQLLVARARIIKNAAAKPACAAAILASRYRDGHRWLVYCDNREQVSNVRSMLVDRGIRSWEYYRGMEGDPDNTLKAFDINGGVVVSIRCLDEGVDIPASDHALILASSRNPREHIQRRGRVLRRASFKPLAYLFDVLTLPATIDPNDSTVGAVIGEVARAMEFASWSLTRQAESIIRDKWVTLGLSLDALPGTRTSGVEDDNEDDSES
jgi:superfamily II DNA or RNA helicase